MDEWIAGWMDARWSDEGMGGWVDECQMNGWTDGQREVEMKREGMQV